MKMSLAAKAVAVVVGLGAVAAVTPALAALNEPAAGPAPAPAKVPANVDAGIAVFDRKTGTFRQRSQATKQYRSASLVKLLIAIDHAWNLGPGYQIPEADRRKLDLMLRSSDDAAATEFWSRNGGAAIVERMVTRLALRNSAPPPPGRGWGSTALSAEDIVQVYRYLLDTAPAPVRDLVMGNLHRATKCGTDGFDQSFGIPAAFTGPRSFKQGWVNFGDAPRDPCTEGVSVRSIAPRQSRANEIDYGKGALHTTGTVGARDRTIVVVLSLHTAGTGYKQAFYNLTKLTRSLNVPGVKLAPPLPQPPPGRWFGTWSSNVAVRADATNASAQVGTVPTGVEVLVRCQVRGEEVVHGNIRNDWWTYLPEFGGYMSNIFFNYPDNQLPDVPDC